MRASTGIVVVALVALLAGCGESKTTPIRIGVLSDCYGPFSQAHELVLASAELPLIERGAQLRGRNPSDGVTAATVAGREIELEVGCVTGTEDVIPEARRLVEEDGAQILVGPFSPEHGLALSAYARRRPEVTFLVQPSGAPETTLAKAAPNIFRFTSDAAQSVAGLGRYAFVDLGWRTAAVVGDDAPYAWDGAAGFIAEFCSLGGRIVDRQWISIGTDLATTVPNIPSSADGVYLADVVSPTLGFIERYAALRGGLTGKLVANSNPLFDPVVVPKARGLVVAGNLPFEPTAATQAYVAEFTRAFPRIPRSAGTNPLAVPFRDGVEAALQALEEVDADLSDSGGRFRGALARVELASPSGRIRLDHRRQAVAPGYLTQATLTADGKPGIRTLRVVPNVEQTFGGYFKPSDPPPSRTSPACKRHKPPPWARK